MDPVRFFEEELNIKDNHYDFRLDDDGHVIGLSIYDYDYWNFEFEGDLIQALKPLLHLKSLEIEVSDYTITDINGLAAFEYLERLELIECCQLDDISVLSQLKQLTYLTITGAGIDDIEPLRNLHGLKALSLFSNKIQSIKPLEGHTGLLNAILSYNQLNEVSVLINCTGLKVLYVDNNKVSDLSYISTLNQLEHLSFNNNEVRNINFLRLLPLIKTLSFSGNPVADITPLAGLKELKQLAMYKIPVVDISPLVTARQLGTLIAGPVKNFDDKIISQLVELSTLNLEYCNIISLAFLAPLKRLNNLMLDNNAIVDYTPLVGLSNLSHISLQNNGINKPFLPQQFLRLNHIDLRGNPFGNKQYAKTYTSKIVFPELYKDIANYWFDQGDNDKALAYYYIDVIDVIPLRIYYKKLLATDPADQYFYLYYVMRCQHILSALKDESNKYVLNIREQLIEIVKNSSFFNRDELLVILKERKSIISYYTDYTEYTIYVNSGQELKPHPEMLFKLAKNSFNKREHLDKLLSLYQQLIWMEHPLQIQLYYIITDVLDRSFASTEEERKASDYYRSLLLNIERRSIPFFDTVAWFKGQYKNFVRSKITPQTEKKAPVDFVENHESTPISNKTLFFRLLLGGMVLFSLMKGCHIIH